MSANCLQFFRWTVFNSVGELSSKCMSVNCLVDGLSRFLSVYTTLVRRRMLPHLTWFYLGAVYIKAIFFNIIQLLTNEALDMMWYRPDNTNIDRGEAEVNIGILWSISHHIQCLISQYLFYYITFSERCTGIIASGKKYWTYIQVLGQKSI